MMPDNSETVGDRVSISEDQIDGENPEQSSTDSEEEAVDAVESENAESESVTNVENADEDGSAADWSRKGQEAGPMASRIGVEVE